MESLLGLNLIFNVGALFGVSVWLESRDPFIFTSFYYLYWVTLCSSFIISSISLLFYQSDRFFLSQKQIIIVSFLLASFWTATAFGITFLLKECRLLYLDCHGEIISVSFCYSLALLWTIIFIINLRKNPSRVNYQNI